MDYNSEERQKALRRWNKKMETGTTNRDEIFIGLIAGMATQLAVMADTLEDIKSYLRDQSNQ